MSHVGQAKLLDCKSELAIIASNKTRFEIRFWIIDHERFPEKVDFVAMCKYLKPTGINPIYAESDDGKICRSRFQGNCLDLGCSLLTSPSIERYFLEHNAEDIKMDHWQLLE